MKLDKTHLLIAGAVSHYLCKRRRHSSFAVRQVRGEAPQKSARSARRKARKRSQNFCAEERAAWRDPTVLARFKGSIAFLCSPADHRRSFVNHHRASPKRRLCASSFSAQTANAPSSRFLLNPRRRRR